MSSRNGTILVTGTNGGLGSAIVSRIVHDENLTSQYGGLFTVRSASAATKLKSVLASAPKGFLPEIVDLDLGSLASVRKVAKDINRRVATGYLPPIRALILNAGYQDASEMYFTEDGYETTWQVNYLANHLLALLLLQSLDKEKGRIVIVGSWSHDVKDKRNDIAAGDYKNCTELFPGPERLAKGEWNNPESGGGVDAGFRRYGASKLCAIFLMQELAERLAKDAKLSNILVAGLDPGAMSSDLARRSGLVLRTEVKLVAYVAGAASWLFPNGTIRSTSKSAGDVLRLCFDVDLTKGKADYFNGDEPHDIGEEAKDLEKRKQLWEYGLQAAKIADEDTALDNLHY